jgi:hypothetical protein
VGPTHVSPLFSATERDTRHAAEVDDASARSPSGKGTFSRVV